MSYRGDGKPDEFYPRGTFVGRHQVPAADEYRKSHAVSEGLNFPVLGVIDKVYYSNMSTNSSNNQNNVYSSNIQDKKMDAAGRYTTTEFTTKSKGSRLEADVKIVKGPRGVADSGNIMRNVPLCIGFGGIKNYGFVVPTPTTNVSTPQFTGTENGDWCLVQFIGGSYTGGVITHIWPNQLNTQDPASLQEGIFAYSRMAGTQVIVSKDGNFVLDSRNAGEEVTTDPHSGSVSTKRANGTQGAITVISRGDVVIAAGFPRNNESESSLPAGKAALKASKVLSLRSTLDEVTLNTQADATDGAAMQVKIQNERGSLRPAARKDDKIKITDGDEGDLFSFIGTLYDLLDAVGSTLETFSQDPGALAAGSMITAFIGCHPKPTYAEGKIIEGSKYCQIAGEGTAADVGGDESGIVNSSGEQVSSSELVSLELAAYATAIPKVIASKISPNPITQAKGAIPGTLQKIAKSLELSPPPGPAVAIGIKEAAKILPTIFEMISTGSITPDAVDGKLPTSAVSAGYASMDAIVGKYDDDPADPNATGKLITPGLLQQSEAADLTNDYMQKLVAIQQGTEDYTQSQLESLYGTPNSVEDGLPTGPVVAINPGTGEYWKVGDDVVTNGSLGKNAVDTASAEAATLSTKLQSVMGGFDATWFAGSGIVPPTVKTYTQLLSDGAQVTAALAALGASPTYAAVLAAVTPLIAAAGEGLVQEVEKEVDKELSSL